MGRLPSVHCVTKRTNECFARDNSIVDSWCVADVSTANIGRPIRGASLCFCGRVVCSAFLLAWEAHKHALKMQQCVPFLFCDQHRCIQRTPNLLEVLKTKLGKCLKPFNDKTGFKTNMTEHQHSVGSCVHCVYNTVPMLPLTTSTKTTHLLLSWSRFLVVNLQRKEKRRKTFCNSALRPVKAQNGESTFIPVNG